MTEVIEGRYEPNTTYRSQNANPLSIWITVVEELSAEKNEPILKEIIIWGPHSIDGARKGLITGATSFLDVHRRCQCFRGVFYLLHEETWSEIARNSVLNIDWDNEGTSIERRIQALLEIFELLELAAPSAWMPHVRIAKTNQRRKLQPDQPPFQPPNAVGYRVIHDVQPTSINLRGRWNHLTMLTSVKSGICGQLTKSSHAQLYLYELALIIR